MVAGGSSAIVVGAGALTSIVNAIIEGVRIGEASGVGAGLSTDGAGAGTSCATLMCVTQVGGIQTTITLNDCVVPTLDGSVTYDGTVTLTGSGNCLTRVPLSGEASIAVAATFKSGIGATLFTNTADLEATYAISTAVGGECTISLVRITGANLTLNGTLMITGAGLGTALTVEFENTIVVVAIEDYDTDCVPIRYSLTFTGEAVITQTFPQQGVAAGIETASFRVTFGNFGLAAEIEGNATLVELSGSMSSACFGGSVNLSTMTPLSMEVAQVCPESGVVDVSNVGRITYVNQMVSIDTDFDGDAERAYGSCLSPELLCALP
jgi:hypothetical protein